MAIKTSALVPCKDTREHIVQCVESLLEFDEVIVLFDCCEDDSQAILQGWLSSLPNTLSSKVRLESCDYGNCQDCRNHLYELSTGDYLNFFDADDFRIAGTLTPTIQTLEASSPNIAGCITPYYHYYREPFYREERYTTYKIDWMDEAKYRGDEFPPSAWWLMGKRNIQTGGIVWKKEALEEIRTHYGYVWDRERIGLQDTALVLNALKLGLEFSVLPLYTHYYRSGWSKKQVTKASCLDYAKAAVEFLEGLHSIAPEKYKKVIADEIFYTAKNLRELENTYKTAYLATPETPYLD